MCPDCSRQNVLTVGASTGIGRVHYYETRTNVPRRKQAALGQERQQTPLIGGPMRRL